MQPFARVSTKKILVLSELRGHKLNENSVRPETIPQDKDQEDVNASLTSSETNRSAQKRVVQSMQSLILHHPEEIVAIAMHSSAIALFLNAIDPQYTFEQWQQQGVPSMIRLVRGEYGLSWTHIDVYRPTLSLVRNEENRV